MNERGGIFTKMAIFIALLGAIAFQAGAIVVAKVQVDGIAINAAEDAGLEYGKSASPAKARQIADHVAETGGAVVTGFIVDLRRKVVIVTVEKDARAFLLDKIRPWKKYAVEASTHEGTIR